MSFGSAVKRMMIPSIWFFCWLLFYSLCFLVWSHTSRTSTFSLQILIWFKWISPSSIALLLTDDGANRAHFVTISLINAFAGPTQTAGCVTFDMHSIAFPFYFSACGAIWIEQIQMLTDERNGTTVSPFPKKNKCNSYEKKNQTTKYFVYACCKDSKTNSIWMRWERVKRREKKRTSIRLWMNLEVFYCALADGCMNT